MKHYYRIILGKKNIYADACVRDGYIGIYYDYCMDMSGQVEDDWREFNKKFIPMFMGFEPTKSRIAAGLGGGTMWQIVKGIKIGDIVLCPVGNGIYRAGEVISEYFYQPDGDLQHCRRMKWFPVEIERAKMTDGLRGSTGATNTIISIDQHSVEIEQFLAGQAPPVPHDPDESVENPAMFAMEKHLEDFLVRNWAQTELGRDYDVYSLDGEPVGQQYPSDTGPIDILAISKDKKTLLVVELKRGRASDTVVGQIQRYMGYVQDELAEPGQTVKGIIIALEDDVRIKRALSVTANIEFYRYQMTFKLVKG